MTEANEVPLRFDRIDVVRAPGFETSELQVADLSSGVTIVHGPNAAGKTTFARSLHHLLWPAECDDRSTLVGQFSLDGESWRVKVDGSRVEYQLNGQAASRPNLPPVDQRDRYFLALDRFLQDGTRDASLARAIKRESAGGYDLTDAYDALGFSDSPSTRRPKVVDQAESAVEEWRATKRELADLKAEQERLAPLRQELAEARAARDRVELLGLAIDHAETRDELAAREAALEAFPDVLGGMDGGEAETVAKLDARIEEWERDLEQARGDRAAAEADLEAVDLPEGGLPSGFVSRLKTRQDELSALEDRRQGRIERLEGARDRRERALEDAPFDADADALAAIDPVDWPAIADFIDEAAAVRSDRQTLESVERWLGDCEPPARDPSALQRGCQCLERWLGEGPGGADVDVTMAFLVALVGGLSFGGAGVALALLVHPVFALLLAVGGWMLWTAAGLYRASGTVGRSRAAHRAAFEQLGLKPPRSWSEDDVRVRLNELYDAVAEQKLAKERETRRDALEPRIEGLEDREATLEERRAELIDRSGLDPAVSDLEFAAFAKAVARWHESHDEVVALEGELRAIEAELEAVSGEIDVDVEPYGYEPVADAAEAAQHVNDLEERSHTYERATDGIDQAAETIDRATAKIEHLESEREAVFADVGLEPDEGDRLRELCDQFEEYDAARSERDDAALLLETAKQELATHPDFEPDLEDRSVSALESTQREAEETAERYDALHTEIAEIETKVSEAKRDNDLETAVAGKDRTLAALDDRLHADYQEMVGHVLVEHLRSDGTETSRSAVLEGAREVLATITKGRYRLDVDERAETFRAYDTVEERGYGLDELSSGTRLQLLLSVRVAFVEHQEPGVKLPLILDETLANSDDGKAAIVIDSMLELARDGRQVVYLTAQGDEVAKWLRALEDVDELDHAVIDLAEVRGLDRRVTVPSLDDLPVEPAAPPDPAEHDHASYGEALDVPPFDPRRGAGHAHLWHLVDDLDLLYRLLDLGVERWGQLETLAGRTSHEVFADDPTELERVRQNGAALEEFVRCWQRGRGSPVTREALEQSGAVSDTFIDEVANLAEELDGDAERLIEALRDGRVDRFRSGKTNDLEAYFEAEGHIDTVEALDPDQIRPRVAAAFVEAGVDRERAGDCSSELLSRIAAS